jgi:haloalkane dehalogenase
MLPAGRRDAELRVAGERMHVSEWGPPDGRPVLLVHGNPTWSFLWRRVVAAIRVRPGGDRLRLIAPDLIGLGRSSKPALDAHSLHRHAGWLGEAIDRLAPGPLAVVAQDWGGPITLRALAEPARRDRLRALVLGNTAVGPPAPTFRPTLFHRLSQLPVASDVLFRGLGFPIGVLHFSQGDRGSIRGDVARAYRWPLRALADRAAPLAMARMVPDQVHGHPSIPDLHVAQELYETAAIPVALVWGERDPILGRALGRMAKLRPDAVVTKTRAGHFLQEEVPDELADAALSVVARAAW